MKVYFFLTRLVVDRDKPVNSRIWTGYNSGWLSTGPVTTTKTFKCVMLRFKMVVKL